jgi:hypothetical protein
MRVNLTNDDPLFRILRAPEGEEGAAAEPGEAEGGEKKEEPVKPDWRDRRIARLTAEKRNLEARVSQVAAVAPARAVPEGEVDREAIRNEERQRMAAEAAQAEFDNACNKVAADGKKRYSDWDATINKITNAVAPLHELEGKYRFVTLLLDTSDPDKVLHDLGQDPDRMEEVLNMRPGKMVIELEKIAKAKPKKDISEVDPPPGHIDGGTGGVRNPLTNPKAPMSDYAKARNAELMERAKKGDNKARRLLGQSP